MADLKISQLSDGGNSQATDEYVIARSGANYRIDGASVAAAATSVGTLTSLTVSGDLTVDTSTLKVDSTNNRVGIGTASPGQTLDVSSTSTNVARFATTAAASFSIMQLSGNSSGGSLEFRNGATGLSAVVGTTTGTGDLKFYTNAFNTLAATIDSAGNLGLGVTPTFDLEVTKSKPSNTVDLMVKNTGTTGTSNARLLVYVDSTSGGDPKMGVGITAVRDYFWYIDNSDSDKLKLSDSGTDILEIIDGSSLALKGASSASGTGITFPATQSASSNANTLDDYEEGTWTPTLPNGGTINVVQASYTKIGRVVTATLHVELVAPTNNGSEFQLGGLPFTSANTSNQYLGGYIGYAGDSDLSVWTPLIRPNTSYVYFHVLNGNTGTRTNANYITAASGSVDSIILSVIYFSA